MNGACVVVALGCGAAWLLALLPTLVYLRTRWNTRHLQLLALLSDDALEFYFAQFRRSEKHDGAKQLRAAFRSYIDFADGRRHFVLPLVMLGLVTAVGLWGSAKTVIDWLNAGPGGVLPHALAISAFAGAYAWVVGDQFSRFQTRDFTPHDVYGCVYRLLIAVPLAYSLTAALKVDLGVPFAFLLGAFPTRTLMTIARRLASQNFHLGDTDDRTVNELALLQGINKSAAERFESEGITSITELAWADPIDLTMRTNFDLWFVVDCCSQALLWVYLGNALPKLYKFSLRGAMEATYLLLDLKGEGGEAEKKIAQTALAGAAEVLSMSADSLRYTLEEAARDPYTIFLCSVWDEQVTADDVR
jgi:hypothetical protein